MVEHAMAGQIDKVVNQAALQRMKGSGSRGTQDIKNTPSPGVSRHNIIHRFKRLSIWEDGFYLYFYAYLLAFETLIHDTEKTIVLLPGPPVCFLLFNGPAAGFFPSHPNRGTDRRQRPCIANR